MESKEVPAELKAHGFEWVECFECGGCEGYNDENDCWHDCSACDGDGGWYETPDAK